MKYGRRELLLLGIVNGNGKVLPRRLVDRGRPDLSVLSVEDLPRVLGQIGLAQDRARLEVELVGRVIGCFVPDVLFFIQMINFYLTIMCVGV